MMFRWHCLMGYISVSVKINMPPDSPPTPLLPLLCSLCPPLFFSIFIFPSSHQRLFSVSRTQWVFQRSVQWSGCEQINSDGTQQTHGWGSFEDRHYLESVLTWPHLLPLHPHPREDLDPGDSSVVHTAHLVLKNPEEASFLILKGQWAFFFNPSPMFHLPFCWS